MGNGSQLNAWVIPPTVLAEWLTLSTLLEALPDRHVPCRAGDAAAWWPDRKQLASPATQAAVVACEGCPARDAYRACALAAGEREGVWGGTLPAERRTVQRPAAA